nr:MAG: 19.7 kDa protein [Grapevine leafroll-associated virus 3]
MRPLSLRFLILRLSRSIKTNDHLVLILIKEALINYYNSSFTNEDLALIDTRESIGNFLLARPKSQMSCSVMKALVTNIVCTMSIDTARKFIGDLILVADASISALEEAKYIRDDIHLTKKRGKYYYSGSCGSDIAKVRYELLGESTSNECENSLKLRCEGKGDSGNVLQYILTASLG